MNKKLDSIVIVMVKTTHPGNIGAAARAMKNMGLSQLRLVNPSQFPHVEATARASGADDILKNAQVCDSLDEAIKNCHLIVGTSARVRTLSLPLLSARECGEKLINEASNETKTAIIFGTENSGLTNDELLKCHFHVHIPTEETFYSLNLASAVQLIAYELRMAWLNETKQSTIGLNPEAHPLANALEMDSFYDHLRNALEDINFLNHEHAHQIMQRLKRLFNRAQLEQREIHILRGIFKAIQQRQKK